MKGLILSFDIQSSTGIISGEDGNRYNFLSSSFQTSNVNPSHGLEVDFEIKDINAISIYVINQKESLSSLKKEDILTHYINGFKNYINFKGRINRSGFWYYHLVSFIVTLILIVISAGFLGVIYSLLIIIPNFAIGARRLHDTDRSAWWQLIGIIPLIGIIVLIIFWAQESKIEKNKYDLISK
ncbi:MAG: DUF805 domain-containing protein [Campylobacteraceae bacterium]|nr:DUF805 domain-containing protein [Campylobacteraceae bacterium]